MSLGAMCLFYLVCPNIPTPAILSASYGLQVPRIDTPSVTAQVVKFQPFRNKANVVLVRENV